MKRIVSVFLLVAALLFTSCQAPDSGAPQESPTESSTIAPVETSTEAPTEPTTESPAQKLLDGKKVAFLGCSYTFRTYAVHKGMGIASGMENRVHDEETFYRLCKENGAEVDVLDWTFSNHALGDIIHSKTCRHCSRNHVDDLTDRYYDYVVLMEIDECASGEDYLKVTEEAMQFFREANPNVEFIYVVHHATYFSTYGPEWREGIALIQNTGVKMIDWGTLYLDIVYGQVEVPGAEHDFNKFSFIISKTASDGYHPNPLIGYLYSLMVYCAITGEKAEGQPYAFMTEGEQLEKWENYKKNSYCFDNPKTEFDERDTNFIDVLSSAADIKGLQTLVDSYMNTPTKSILKYNVRFLNDDGSLIEEKEYYYGNVPECADPQKPGDNQGEYEFAGWDRELTRCFEDTEYTAVYQKKP